MCRTHVLLTLITFVGCDLVNWRYTTKWENVESLVTGRTVSLESLGAADSFLWALDPGTCSGCTLTNESLAISSLTCSRSTSCHVTLDADGTTTSNDLQFRDQPYSYRWFVSSRRSSSNGWYDVTADNSTYNVSVSIWVLDPLLAEQDELDGTANEPCQSSILLSQQMRLLGQRPRLRFPINEYMYSGPDDAVFNQDCSCWELELVLSTALRPMVLVTAAPIDVMGKFIRDTLTLLPRTFNNSGDSQLLELLPASDAARPQIFKDPSHGQGGVLWYRQDLRISQDGFVTTSNLTASDQSVANISDVRFSHVALTNSRIGLLSSAGTVYSMDKATAVLLPIEELSGCTLSGLRGRDNFVEGRERAVDNDLLVTWGESGLAMVGVGNLTATLQAAWPTQLLTDSGYLASVTVHDGAFTAGLNTVGMALTATHASLGKQVVVVLYDYTRDRWSVSEPGLVNPDVLAYRVRFVTSGKLSYVLWTTKTTFCFHHEGSLATTKLYAGLADFLEADEEIQQLETTIDGDLLMLTTKNRVFFSRPHITSWTQLTPWETPAVPSALWMDGLGRFYSLTLDDLDSRISRQFYPLDHELARIRGQQHDCQYLSMSHTLDRQVFVMDLGDSHQFTVDLLLTTAMNNSLQVTYDERSFLIVNETTTISVGKGVVVETRVLTISHQDDFRGEQNYSEAVVNRTGVFSFEVSPTEVTNSCGRPSRVVVLLDVGCPRGRHIALKRTRASEVATCSPVASFVIPRKHYHNLDGSLGLVDKVVSYNSAQWGCPIRLYNARIYSPRIQLLDADALVLRDVEADYVMWEEFEQSSLNYNTSMLKVGCLRVAQQWVTLRQAILGEPLDQVWGPWNYVNCFELESNLSSSVLRPDYEVLNSSNHVAFSLVVERNGLFVLNIQVVDPNYSFCPLRTQFTLEIFGATSMTGHVIPLAASVSGFIVSTIIALCISYYFFGKFVYQKEFEL